MAFPVFVKNSMVCRHCSITNAASSGRLNPLRQCKQSHQQRAGVMCLEWNVLSLGSSAQRCFQSSFVKIRQCLCSLFYKDCVTSVSEELVGIQTSRFLTDFRPSAVVITDVAVCVAVNQK